MTVKRMTKLFVVNLIRMVSCVRVSAHHQKPMYKCEHSLFGHTTVDLRGYFYFLIEKKSVIKDEDSIRLSKRNLFSLRLKVIGLYLTGK